MERLPFAQLCPNSPLELQDASHKRESGPALPPRRQSAPGARVRSTAARRHATSTFAAQLAACGPMLAQPQAAGPSRPGAARRADSVVGAMQGAALDAAPQCSLELPAEWQQASLVGAAPRVAGAAAPRGQGTTACSSASGEQAGAEAAAEALERGDGAPGAAAPPAGPAGPHEGASPGGLPAGDWAAALLESWDVRWEALLSPELREVPTPRSKSGSVPQPGLGPCAPASPPAAAGAGCPPLSELLAAAEAAAADGPGATLEASDAGNGPAEGRAGTSGATRAEDAVTSGYPTGLEFGGKGRHDDTDDLLAALLQGPRGAAGGSQRTLWKVSADGAPAGAARGHVGFLGPRGAPRRGKPAAHASPDGRARAGKRKCSRSPSAASEGCAARRLAAGNPAANPQDASEGSTLLQPTAASSCARANSPEWQPGEWAPAPPQGRAAAAQGRARLAARLARVRAEVSSAPPTCLPCQPMSVQMVFA